MCSGAAPKLSLSGAAIHQILHLKYPIAFWLQVQIIDDQDVVTTPPTVEELKEGNKTRYFQNGNVDQIFKFHQIWVG